MHTNLLVGKSPYLVGPTTTLFVCALFLFLVILVIGLTMGQSALGFLSKIALGLMGQMARGLMGRAAFGLMG